jgi:excisionase family DNA binding protein
MNLIDLKTLGNELSLSVYTLRKLIREGMPHYRIGRKLLINRSEVEPWFARHFRQDADSNNDALDKILEKALAKIDRENVD